MTKYSERLRDPRWQKKRLEIMERDGFACRRCACTEKPLNVHHIAYYPAAMPWEYPSHMLITLCEDHHKKEEDEKSEHDGKLVEAIRGCGAMNSDMARITQIIRELGVGPATLGILQRGLDEIWTEAKK